jgi:hypothetical protein
VPHLSRCTVPVVALAQPTPPCQRLVHFLGLVAPSSSACSAQGTGLVHSELAPVTDRGEPGLKLATHPATVSKNVHLQGAAERNTSVGQRVAYVRRARLAHRQKNKIKFRLRSMLCVRSTRRDTVAFLPTFAWSRSTRTHRPVNVAYLSCPDPPVSLLPDGEGRSRSPPRPLLPRSFVLPIAIPSAHRSGIQPHRATALAVSPIHHLGPVSAALGCARLMMGSRSGRESALPTD